MKKETYILTSETAQGLNEEITSLEEDGYESVGQHTVVVDESNTSMGGQTVRNTLEYSITMVKVTKE